MAAAGAVGAAGLPVAGRLAAAAEDAGASAFARVGMRLLTFSTTTALVRPWLKLWRTTPCSTPRPLRLNALLGATLSFFSPVFSVVSAIPISTQFPVLECFIAVDMAAHGFARHLGSMLPAAGRRRNRAGPEPFKARCARHKRFAFRSGKQGCM